MFARKHSDCGTSAMELLAALSRFEDIAARLDMVTIGNAMKELAAAEDAAIVAMGRGGQISSAEPAGTGEGSQILTPSGFERGGMPAGGRDG